MSRISIIIPTFNRATLLCEAIRGLDTQVECVIVDDASSDDTLHRVTAVQSEWREGQIVFLRQKTHQGAQAARNYGIERATGEFLLFLDSDDVPRPEGILKLYDHLQSNPNVDYCFGWVQKTDARLNSLGDHERVGSPFGDEPLAIAGYHWHTMGALYRRSCVERVGPWNPELTGCQDWEYQARVKMFGGNGEFVDTLVGYWRQHDGERVGTACFRPDYVRSVMLACESILAHSRACGRRSAALEKRIAKKLVIHALEWGANGYLAERRACFEQAVTSLGGIGCFSAILRAWSKVSNWGDASLWKLLTRS